MDFHPATTPAANATELPDGVHVRIQQGAQTFEQWVPAGWQISIPTSPAEVQVAYGWQQIPLPVGIELLEFEVKRNEGLDSPAGFKSTVRVTNAEGESATGQCWMNNPFSFPTAWWRSWTGLTYKMSQASWNPENLAQSTDSDFARSRLAPEMDRIASHRHRNFPVVLCARISKTNRRSADSSNRSRAA